jgi:hypothetical protein
VPDDLLRYVVGPEAVGFPWLALALLVALAGWYAIVFVWTRPRRVQRSAGPLAKMRDTMARTKFAREAHRIGERCRRGEISAAAAGAELSTVLRTFLHQHTGEPVPYMHVDDVARSRLAAAAPILVQLNDVQFNDRSEADARALSTATEELILSWT